MPEGNFGENFPYPDVLPSSFNGDPEEALRYARKRQFQRYRLAAFRASLAFFDGWRPESAALPWVERLMGYLPMIESRGARGPAPPLQPLLDMKSLGEAVNGTCLSSAGLLKEADKVVSRAGGSFKPTPKIQGVLDTRHAQIVVKLFRFAEAQELADRAVQAFANDTGDLKPFCCRDTTLLARGYVRSCRYLFANAPVETLLGWVADAQEVLSSSNPRLATNAADMLVAGSACMCFAGFEPPPCPNVPLPRGRMQAAKSRWSRALLSCARTRYLSDKSEQQFRSSRVELTDLGLSLDVIHITLDLQFWLIVSGRLYQAADESDLVRTLLPSIDNEDHEEAVTLWLSEIDNLMLTYQTAERVLTEVRQVGQPNNLRLLIGNRS